MKKYKIILIIIFLFLTKIEICATIFNTDTINTDTIDVRINIKHDVHCITEIQKELENYTDKGKYKIVNEIEIVNDKLDSVLCNLFNFLKSNSKVFFHVTIAKIQNSINIEIVEDNTNLCYNGREIYGIKKYCDNIDIYFYLFKGYAPFENELNNLVNKTDKTMKVHEYNDGIPFQENPLWLYEYTNNEMILVKSVNDKGFFTNP